MFDMRAYVARMVIVLFPLLVAVFFMLTSWGWLTVLIVGFITALSVSGLMAFLARVLLRDERQGGDV